MAQLTFREAIARGIAQEMRRDDSVVFLGEDVGAAGGVFKGTVGLIEEFGPVRVRDTPISEQAILGAAMGAAMTGLRPVAETSRNIVVMSSGTRDRTSTTVHSIPVLASSSAAASVLGTIAPSATTVASDPLRSTFAEPSVSTISPSGTSIFDA